MDSVGELLLRERLRQGLELTDIAERTRINLGYLEAIEAGDLARLPGAFFYRAFVRQYARALGIDESSLEPALNALREQAEAVQPLPDVRPAPQSYDVPPVPAPGTSRRLGPRPSSIVLLLAVMVACGGVYALWQSSRRVEPPAPPPTRVEARAPAPALQEPQPPAALTPPAALPPESPKPPEPAFAQSRAAAPPVTQPAKPPAPELARPPAPEPAATGARLTIDVSASDTVWFSATVDGKKITSVLKDGQTRRFAANERVSLFFGNAGGVDVRVNGKSIGPLGPRGQLRTVLITPEGFAIANPREKKEQPAPPTEP